MKISCDKCNQRAVWKYMPSDGYGNYCDECVLRGCSCNYTLESFDTDLNPLSEWISEQNKDKCGRLLPCCEYDYNIEGFNQEDYD